jgi:toxin ParE1/3/4
MMKLVYSRESINQLDDISDFIALDNPVRANSFVAELREACDKIKISPAAYPKVDLKNAKNVRKKVFKPYIIYYSIQSDFIFIHHIIHGARDQSSVFKLKKSHT